MLLEFPDQIYSGYFELYGMPSAQPGVVEGSLLIGVKGGKLASPVNGILFEVVRA